MAMTSAIKPNLAAFAAAGRTGAGRADGKGSGSGGNGATVDLSAAATAIGAPQRSQNLAPGTDSAPQDSQ
jgi:hypothetical protein